MKMIVVDPSSNEKFDSVMTTEVVLPIMIGHIYV